MNPKDKPQQTPPEVEPIEFDAIEIKIARFKGHLIERFLRVEYLVEKIITAFFYNEPIPERYAESIGIARVFNMDTMHMNAERLMFFEYIMHPHPFVTTKMKMDFLQIIMQIRTPKFYREVTTKKHLSIFQLLEKLNDLRNAIAHTIAYHDETHIIIGKRKSKFKTSQETVESDGKKEVIERGFFNPIFEVYRISEKHENEIHLQIDIIQIILQVYLKRDMNLPPEAIAEKEKLAFDNSINSSQIFGNDFGVFAALQSDQQRERQEEGKKKENTKKAKSSEQEANRAKNQNRKA